MCGIVGVITRDASPVSEETLISMRERIRHRGPDGNGLWIEDNVGFGHCRLAVLDLSLAGQQPMISANQRFVISYNGEVYNFHALRRELEQKGCQFTSRTDTEVVLNAYIEWGVSCVDRLQGMFALAIWDKEKRTLFLARDRYGIKPLYYSDTGNVFLFASEIKGMLPHKSLRSELDVKALLEYFTFQNLFTNRTFHKNVSMFPAGCYALFKPEDEGVTPTRYWDYSFSEIDSEISEEECLEQVDLLMQQAVQRHLVSDVDIGCYLSGGLDSGSITALAARHLPNVRTFTIGFDVSSVSGLEVSFDERAAAERMSYLFQTEHYEMVLKAGDMERCIDSMVWHLEEPRVGQSYPNWYAAKLASAFDKVVLSGTGGDEIFGGYPWRYYRAVFNSDFEDYIDKYYLYWNRLIPNSTIKKVFQPIWNEVSEVWTRDIMRDTFKTHMEHLTRPEDYVNHSLYFEAKTFLHGLLVVEDKLSMAHGLESRVPFLDNDLVDFALQIPVRYKLKNLLDVVRLDENELNKKRQYFQKTKEGKHVLRQAMERYVTPEVSQRIKQGFSAPDASWFKGESIDYTRARILNPNARIYDYLDRKEVAALVEEHLSGRANRRLLIWSLLNTEAWLDQFL